MAEKINENFIRRLWALKYTDRRTLRIDISKTQVFKDDYIDFLLFILFSDVVTELCCPSKYQLLCKSQPIVTYLIKKSVGIDINKGLPIDNNAYTDTQPLEKISAKPKGDQLPKNPDTSLDRRRKKEHTT